MKVDLNAQLRKEKRMECEEIGMLEMSGFSGDNQS